MSNIKKYLSEDKVILDLIQKYSNGKKILDVGCGYGRFLQLLSEAGYLVTGVEINSSIVNACRLQGFCCIAPSELDSSTKGNWDVVLMAHIIEHFSPLECFDLIDEYLDYLKIGGILVIATPLMTDYFYEDFDHIKPYYPLGINMVFSANGGQVQYVSRNKLQLTDLKYKKYFYRIVNHRSVYFPEASILFRLWKEISKALFKLSFGIIGKKDGWIGVYKKVK